MADENARVCMMRWKSRERERDRERGRGGRRFCFKRPFRCVPVYIIRITYLYNNVYKYFLFLFFFYIIIVTHISRDLGSRARTRIGKTLQYTRYRSASQVQFYPSFLRILCRSYIYIIIKPRVTYGAFYRYILGYNNIKLKRTSTLLRYLLYERDSSGGVDRKKKKLVPIHYSSSLFIFIIIIIIITYLYIWQRVPPTVRIRMCFGACATSIR